MVSDLFSERGLMKCVFSKPFDCVFIFGAETNEIVVAHTKAEFQMNHRLFEKVFDVSLSIVQC